MPGSKGGRKRSKGMASGRELPGMYGLSIGKSLFFSLLDSFLT